MSKYDDPVCLLKRKWGGRKKQVSINRDDSTLALKKKILDIKRQMNSDFYQPLDTLKDRAVAFQSWVDTNLSTKYIGSTELLEVNEIVSPSMNATQRVPKSKVSQRKMGKHTHRSASTKPVFRKRPWIKVSRAISSWPAKVKNGKLPKNKHSALTCLNSPRKRLNATEIIQRDKADADFLKDLMDNRVLPFMKESQNHRLRQLENIRADRERKIFNGEVKEHTQGLRRLSLSHYLRHKVKKVQDSSPNFHNLSCHL